MSVRTRLASAGFDVVGDPLAGGSGVVYPAVDRTGRRVALKILHLGTDPGRLDREAALLGGIDHPNVVRFVDAGHLDDGSPFLATAWADGHTLDQLPLPVAPARALHIIDQVAAALGALHHRGVVHRDLTPRNVIVDPDNGDRVTVIDLGIGRAADSATVTGHGDVAGTPRYLAPELLEGHEPTPASDQYALATVAYELVAGQWPFGETETFATALHHQLHSRPTPLREVRADLPAAYEAATQRALEKRPEDRYDTIDAFVAALRTERPRASNVRRLALPVALAAVVLAVLAVAIARGGSDDPIAVTTAAETAEPVGAEVDERAVGAVAADDAAEAERGADRSTPADDGTVTAPAADAGATVPTPEPTVMVEPAVGALSGGTAAALPCNRLSEAGFDNGRLLDNFFQHPEEADRATVVDGAGVDGTPALRVGSADDWGKYAEDVPVLAGEHYLFSAYARVEGEVFETVLTVEWLDADFVLIDVATVAVDLLRREPGQLTMDTGPAPPNAAYALPTAFKDSSAGVLYVDELVFAPADADCRGQLLGQ